MPQGNVLYVWPSTVFLVGTVRRWNQNETTWTNMNKYDFWGTPNTAELIPADPITTFISVSLSVVTPFFPPRNGSDLHAILQLVGCWDQLPKIPRSSHYLPIFSRKSPYFYIFFLTPAEGEIPSRSAKEKVAAEFENHGEVSVEQSKYLGGGLAAKWGSSCQAWMSC